MKTNPNEHINGFNKNFTDCDGNPVGIVSHHGLTKREYFAAMALQGAVNVSPFPDHKSCFDTDQYKHRLAIAAVKYADALIEALNTEADHE